MFPEVLEVELEPLLTATKQGWDKVNNSSPVDISACGSNPPQYWGGGVWGERNRFKGICLKRLPGNLFWTKHIEIVNMKLEEKDILNKAYL